MSREIDFLKDLINDLKSIVVLVYGPIRRCGDNFDIPNPFIEILNRPLTQIEFPELPELVGLDVSAIFESNISGIVRDDSFLKKLYKCVFIDILGDNYPERRIEVLKRKIQEFKDRYYTTPCENDEGIDEGNDEGIDGGKRRRPPRRLRGRRPENPLPLLDATEIAALNDEFKYNLKKHMVMFYRKSNFDDTILSDFSLEEKLTVPSLQEVVAVPAPARTRN